MKQRRRATAWSAFYLLPLLSGAVLLGFWLAAQGHEGAPRIETGAEPDARSMSQDPDPEIAQRAQAAVEELQSLPEELDVDVQVLSEYGAPDDPHGFRPATRETETGDPEAIRKETALLMDAVLEPDDDLRADAVHAVGLRRHDDAVTALVNVAAFDPSPEIRHQTLEALWHAAADGLDADGLIKATLEEALADPDPDAAALARRALEDLRALE